MVQTHRGVSSDQIAAQLAVIAAKLAAIEAQWRDDVAALKIAMFGKPTSNQAPPPAPSTPLFLPDFSTKHQPKTSHQSLAPPPCLEQPPTLLQKPTPNREAVPNPWIASSTVLPTPTVLQNQNIIPKHLTTNSFGSLLTFLPNQNIKSMLVWCFLLKPTTQQKASLKAMYSSRSVRQLVHTYSCYESYAVHSPLTGFGGLTRETPNEGVAGRHKWRPPWHTVEIAPHAMVRLEWHPPWVVDKGRPSFTRPLHLDLRTSHFSRGAELIRIRWVK